MDTCVFCRIAAGEAPASVVFEDHLTLAFMDINPANPGHALVIPKFHATGLFDTPADWLADCAATAQKVATGLDRALTPDGINLVQANGEGAAQSVLHFHLHVLPRHNGDALKLNWGMNPGDMDDIAALAEKVREAIS